VNPLKYSPSEGGEWGDFDGSTFSGYLKIPEKYLDLLLLHMLGRCFDEKKIEYELTITRIRGNSGSSAKQEIEYTPVGGYD
ncbi:hypothetical protein, partial [Methanoregula sp.]|uniref:hypothetical protein n=1 Tax=Methanoregula sp. TaxID=2052170 RepID=UPI003568DFBF